MSKKLQYVLTVMVTVFVSGLSVLAHAAPKGSATDIKDCTVISDPGTYNIAVDLPATGGLLPGGHCIEISTSSVVLNIEDHSIIGDGTGAAVIATGVDQNNIKIRQGTITGFVTAIDLAACTGCVVEYIHAFGNSADGIYLGAQGIARYNVVLDNDRGLVMTCPANAIGNSAWDNDTDDLYLIDEELCSLSEGLNSFGDTGGSSTTCESVGLIDCGGNCINPDTDEAYCGASSDCLEGNSGESCGSGYLCNAGSCELTCPAGQAICEGNCIDPNTDERYCGANSECLGGSQCADGQLCVAGSCQLTCQSELANCSGICTDLQTSDDHCGACGNSCGDHGFCVSGSCECDQDYIDEGGCINQKLVECTDVAPDHGYSTIELVTVTYTDAGGWSTPADCVWECDTGYVQNGDSCELESLCGNSIVEPGEECDDGNTLSGDGCDSTCQLESLFECSSCLDCDGQACIDGQCGSCSTNSDCCSPLECNLGTCEEPPS